MITGASQADVGVLVVAANDSVMAQTKEHVFLCKTLGVGQIAVLVNKMDAIGFSKAIKSILLNKDIYRKFGENN